MDNNDDANFHLLWGLIVSVKDPRINIFPDKSVRPYSQSVKHVTQEIYAVERWRDHSIIQFSQYKTINSI